MSILGGDRHVALIEQPVQIGPKQDAIADVMRTILRIRLDVGSLQCRQRVLLRGSTRPTVRVHDGHAEDSLAESRRNELWRSVTRRVFANEHRLPVRRIWLSRPGSSQALLPNSQAFAGSQVVSLVSQVRGRPIARTRHPLVRLKERRLREQNAADLVRWRLRAVVDPGPDAADPLAHGLERRATVLCPKRFPRKPIGQS